MPVPLTAREPVDFTPRIFDKTPKAEWKILVRVPTPFERDSFDAALVRAGVVYYDRQQIRDLTLAAAAELHGREKFDEHKAMLEELWLAGDAQRRANADQAEKFLELTEANKTAEKPLSPKQVIAEVEKIKPDVVMDPIARAHATAFQMDLMGRYEPLHKAFADLAEQDTKRSWIQVETYVTGWKGPEHEPDGNGRGGVRRFEAEYLREQIGSDAWQELSDFIYALHNIDGDTEKNLDSLLAKLPDPIGSTAQESKDPTGSESGNSSGENSSPTPAGGSPETTGRSSRSGRRTGTRTGRSRSTRTAKDGETNP